MRKTALTIAGSDSCGGAGIQADIKTMMACGVYAMSAVTAVTAQNSTGVAAIHELPPDILREQLVSVLSDIPPDAVKIGMVSSADLIGVIADALADCAVPIVLDPVMVATSGDRLLREDALTALTGRLLPLATVVTPNLSEAEMLTGMTLANDADVERAAARLSRSYGGAVLIKGGHAVIAADDLLYLPGEAGGGECIWFRGERVGTGAAHGTGCTLSAAMAAYLARGYALPEATSRAKEYVTQALSAELTLGHGSTLLDHGYDIAP